MGCDIHLRLEKRLKKDREYYNSFEEIDENGDKKLIKKKYYTDTSREWENCYIFSNENTWGNRTYGMFAYLNNVRNYWNDVIPLEDRGFPSDACNYTIEEYSYGLWYGSGEPPEEYGHYISKETYDEWINDRGFETIEVKDEKGNLVETRIIDPDAHSPNWCTTQEMEYCIDKVFKDEEGYYAGGAEEWLALLGAMKGYEASGYYECRAVFWFDN